MKRINVYLSDEEHAKLAEVAERDKRSMSDLVREALNRPPIVLNFDAPLKPHQVEQIRKILKGDA